MEKVINSYECLFIVDTEIGEDAVRAKVDKFIERIKRHAEIVDVNEWGKRRLAYPINDLNEGYYVLATFNAPHAFPAELERLLNIHESIMRSLTIRLEFDAEERAKAKKAAAEAAAAAAEAAAVAAAEAAKVAVEEAPATDAE